MKRPSICLFLLAPISVAGQFINPELTQLKTVPLSPSQDVIANYHPNQQQQFVYTPDGQSVLNASTDFFYNSNGKLSESVYRPTPYNKANDWDKEQIRSVFTYNADGKLTLTMRYALRDGKEVEIDKKSRLYDEHGNLTELHTWYHDASVGYIYAAYDGSYKFHYTYNDAGQIIAIESEWHQPWHDWLKASKRLISYDAAGNFIGIERLPYNADKKEYTLEGACRYKNVRMERFNFEEFFFSGQSLDKLPGVTSYEYQQWNAKKERYETLRRQQTVALKNGQEVRSISFLDEKGSWIDVDQTKTEQALCYRATNEIDGKVAVGQGHWFAYNTANQLTEDITQVWNEEKHVYEPQEKMVYGYKNNENSLTDELSLEIFPNPSSAESFITYSLTEDIPVSIRIADAIGKQVSLISVSSLGTKGKHRELLNVPASGDYQVIVTIGKQSFTKKLIRID